MTRTPRYAVNLVAVRGRLEGEPDIPAEFARSGYPDLAPSEVPAERRSSQATTTRAAIPASAALP